MHKKRQYPFELPYHISDFGMGFLTHSLDEGNLWARIPKAFVQKINAAKSGWDGLTVTQEDMDSLDDAAWAELKEKLGYK